MTDDLLNTKAAAELVGLSPSFLNRSRCIGEGPRFLKLGGAVRYRRSDLENWLASRLQTSTAQNRKPAA